jgi:hypothetical protein
MVKGTQRQHSPQGISQGQVIDLLNQDLCRHLEAIMLSVNYFEMVDCNMDRNAAGQLATQMHKELQWALVSRAEGATLNEGMLEACGEILCRIGNAG